ncbi:MAG: hypothetical protein AAGG44_01555, partial [Planctomycetota bacterium]
HLAPLFVDLALAPNSFAKASQPASTLLCRAGSVSLRAGNLKFASLAGIWGILNDWPQDLCKAAKWYSQADVQLGGHRA